MPEPEHQGLGYMVAFYLQTPAQPAHPELSLGINEANGTALFLP